MATVGTIQVNVLANTEKFHSKMDRSTKSLRKFGSEARKGPSMLGGMVSRMELATAAAGALAVAIAGIALALAKIRERAPILDDLAKTSDRLGLQAQQFRQLQNAAELSGVEVSALGNSLQRFGRRISEAAVGTGEARGALKELSLDAEALRKAGMHEAILRVADAFTRVKDPLDRVRLAQKLFGREGVKMVNMLAAGREGLDSMGSEFDRLAGILTREDLSRVEKMNDGITQMTAAWNGLADEITVAVSPALTDLFNQLAEGIRLVREYHSLPLFTPKGVSGFVVKNPPAAAIPKAIDPQIEKSKQEIEKLQEMARKITLQFRSPTQVFNDRIKELNQLIQKGGLAWGVYDKAVISATRDLMKATDEQKRLNRARSGVSALFRGSAESFSAVQQSDRMGREQLSEQKRTNTILEDIRQLHEDAGVFNPEQIVINEVSLP